MDKDNLKIKVINVLKIYEIKENCKNMRHYERGKDIIADYFSGEYEEAIKILADYIDI